MPVFTENPVRLVLVALAVFRLTHLIWWEFGPWNVFWRLRERMGVLVSNGDGGDVTLYGHTFTGDLFSCPLCLSMWIALAFVILYIMLPAGVIVLDGICAWLAVAAISLMLFGWKRVP